VKPDKMNNEPEKKRNPELEEIQPNRIAAHDINNLFSSIFSNLELLKRCVSSNKEAMGYIENIEHCSRRATDITADVLSTDPSLKSRDRKINTRLLINEVVSSVIHTVSPEIKLKTELPVALADLRGNSTELYQVISNILINAIESIQGQGEVRIKAENHFDSERLNDTDGNSIPAVSIVVQDDGEGIDPENFERIFEPYFSTKNKNRMSGIGLYTVKSIVQAHGGKLEFESFIGEGTRFEILLPAWFEKRRKRTGDKVNVLIADDESLLVSILEDLLTGSGYSVTTVNSAEAAIDILHLDNTFDILIIDFRMEKMTGLDAIKIIRNFNEEIKIILSTGSVGVKSIILNEEIRVDATLQKPYELETLIALIETLA